MRKVFIAFMIGCLGVAAWAASSASEAKRAAHFRINPTYTIHYAKIKPEFQGDWEAYWNSPAWKQAETLSIDQWTTLSTPSHPASVQAKVLYDEGGLRILWRIEKDPYLNCRATKFTDLLYNDSTVETYLEPARAKGYVTLATNACGVYRWRAKVPPVGNSTRLPEKYDNKEPSEELGLKVQVRKSLEQKTIEPPITEPTTWYVESFFPVELLEWACGVKAANLPGATWHGNFFKIMEGTNRPAKKFQHYGSWSNLGSLSDFHQPLKFGTIHFENINGIKTAEAKAAN